MLFHSVKCRNILKTTFIKWSNIKYFESAQPIGLKGKAVKSYFSFFCLILSTLPILDLIILEFVDKVDPKL